jgi:hypothetical protein
MNAGPLQVLLLEDVAMDAELLEFELDRGLGLHGALHHCHRVYQRGNRRPVHEGGRHRLRPEEQSHAHRPRRALGAGAGARAR